MLQYARTMTNITSSTLAMAGAGWLLRVNVVATGVTAGAVHDCAATGDASAANKIASIPATVGTYEIKFPVTTGLVVVPGAGQTVAVMWR